MGRNLITVTARDGDSNTATDTIEVVRESADNDNDGNPTETGQEVAGILDGPGVYAFPVPGESDTRVYVATGGRELADVSVRLLSAMGEVVGSWQGTDLDSVAGAPGVYCTAVGGLSLATGVYLAELNLGDGEVRIAPAIVAR
jgi:hypothetical protein